MSCRVISWIACSALPIALLAQPVRSQPNESEIYTLWAKAPAISIRWEQLELAPGEILPRLTLDDQWQIRTLFHQIGLGVAQVARFQPYAPELRTEIVVFLAGVADPLPWTRASGPRGRAVRAKLRQCRERLGFAVESGISMNAQTAIARLCVAWEALEGEFRELQRELARIDGRLRFEGWAMESGRVGERGMLFQAALVVRVPNGEGPRVIELERGWTGQGFEVFRITR